MKTKTFEFRGKFGTRFVVTPLADGFNVWGGTEGNTSENVVSYTTPKQHKFTAAACRRAIGMALYGTDMEGAEAALVFCGEQ